MINEQQTSHNDKLHKTIQNNNDNQQLTRNKQQTTRQKPTNYNKQRTDNNAK